MPVIIYQVRVLVATLRFMAASLFLRLVGFNNRYFQGKGNVEAGMTCLELRAAGTLGVCCHASNEVDSNSFVTGQQGVYTKLYQKPWCILWRSYVKKLIATSRLLCKMRVYTKLHYQALAYTFALPIKLTVILPLFY